MDKQKDLVVLPQEKIEELSDAQLSRVNGGITMPATSANEKSGVLKFGQALKQNSAFNKSDDRLP